MILRHGKFAERLVQTATQYEGSKVLRGSEAYTSKQCGACGALNDKLGGSKVFTCRSCGEVTYSNGFRNPRGKNSQYCTILDVVCGLLVSLVSNL
jgi:ribosomal protein L37AE/L43A